MPDVRDRIAAWRRPFEESVIYSCAAIDELEDHVWSLVAKAKASGANASESVETALAEVGTESVLREGFLAAWTEMPRWRRWRQRLSAEGRSTSLPAVYRALRLGSLAVGLFGCFMLVALIWELAIGDWRPHWSLDWSEYHYLQGSVLYLTLALTGLFNVVPFRPWSSSVSDRARAVFAVWTIVFIAPSIPLALGAQPAAMVADAVEPYFWIALILIGPAMWVWQLWNRPKEIALAA